MNLWETAMDRETESEGMANGWLIEWVWGYGWLVDDRKSQSESLRLELKS